jgi:hypothetical protein
MDPHRSGPLLGEDPPRHGLGLHVAVALWYFVSCSAMLRTVVGLPGGLHSGDHQDRAR